MDFHGLAAQIYEVGARMKTLVVCAKQNKKVCREIGAAVQALTPILADVEEKFSSLPLSTQDVLQRFIPKLKKYYEEAADFIEAQIQIGSVKKFNASKSTKYFEEELGKNLKSAKDALIAALFGRVDPSVCATPIPSTVGIDKHIESMSLAFKTESYLQVLQIGKEILRKISHDDTMTKAGIHYNMACTYAKLCNTQNVILHLQNARMCGFSDFKQLDEDEEFDYVRDQLEFMNFRQMMEYEILQNEKWRVLSNNLITKLTARFDKYDEEGNGTLSFSQFGALCRREFAITGAAQVVAFWRESCEDTIEAMHLIEFLNFMAEHRDMIGLLTHDSPTSRIKSLSYSGFSPIHTSSSLVIPAHHAPVYQDDIQVQHYHLHKMHVPLSYSIEQTCGWMGEMYRIAADSTSPPFSYYTTTDPLAKFRW